VTEYAKNVTETNRSNASRLAQNKTGAKGAGEAFLRIDQRYLFWVTL
jgi:hypothetical protein